MATLPRADGVDAAPPERSTRLSASNHLRRGLLFAGLLALEALLVAQMHHPWLHLQQPLAAPMVFGAAFLFFARRHLQRLRVEARPFQLSRLLLHLLTLATVAAASAFLLRARLSAAESFVAQVAWYAAVLGIAPSLAATLFPLRTLVGELLRLRSAIAYAALTTLFAIATRELLRELWNAPGSTFGHALQVATFTGARWLLERVYTGVVALPGRAILGTSRFQIIVAGACSGMEGLALILIFITSWLIFARRELRIARAVLLLPVALVLSWLLNLFRIAALIAIGDAGHPALALNGFHSEAGWILFNAIAIGFILTVQHISWLRKANPAAATATATRNVAAIYLLPFLAILATSLITHAASSGFEWLYPLRLVVALAALWWFRADYRALDWRFSWPAPLAGTAVFLLWIAMAHWLIPHRQLHTFPTALTLAAAWQRGLWLATRTLSAVVIIPIAEELAFRGYVARRIVSPDVESIPYAQLTLLSIAISSIAFGLLHGSLWPAGILAGVVFACVAKARNRIGEAIAAHATANVLLAVWVLTRGDFTLW